MFYWLIKRAFDIGRQAIAIDQTFAGLTAKGIGIWLGVQTFINMGVNLGLLPTKGLTLPLMSYGGTGIVINCVGLAILLRIDYENRNMKRLIIMAAGTGGHIFPGLAIAQTMRARGWEVSWLGTSHGMEQELVPKHGIAMDTINFSGMRGKGIKHSLGGALKMLAAFADCFRFLGQRKPDAVLGMGGYVTVPGGLMARLRGVPTVLVNADAALLLSNKTLAPFAERVCFGFPADFGAAAGKAVVTGNPVRKEILELAAPEARFEGRSGALRVLVVGGSLGAKALNDNLPAALALAVMHELIVNA
eukprot:gene1966-2567_t